MPRTSLAEATLKGGSDSKRVAAHARPLESYKHNWICESTTLPGIRMHVMLTDKEIISDLRRDLDAAVRSVISLMPEDARSILESFEDCESFTDTYCWRLIAASAVGDLAKPFPKGIFPASDRAYCPLCRGGALPPSPHEGFALREGLRRHLIGVDGHETQCFVFNAVELGARSYWSGKSYDHEQARLAEPGNRRKSETLFQVDPDGPAKLINEGMSWPEARNPDELKWAQDRLATLGFETHVEKNVRWSYTSKPDRFVVYADPRTIGKIEFRVYLKRRSARGPEYASFKLYDHWKNDILGKYEIRLQRALKCY